MSITVEACESLYDQLCKRAGARGDADREAVAALQRAMAHAGDTGRTERYQAQVILTSARRGSPDDACVLAVFNSAEYDRLLAFMMHWQQGLVGLRSSHAHASPLMLPECFQNDPDLKLLNACLAEIHVRLDHGSARGTTRPHGLPVDDTAWAEFVDRVLHQCARIGIPRHHQPLRVLRPRASVGSLVLWRGWHGSFAAPQKGTPAVAAMVDYAPRSVWTPEQRSASHRLFSVLPWDFGAGSLSCRHAGFNHANNCAHGRTGGLSRLAADERTATVEYVAGDDAAGPIDPDTLASVLTDEQVEELRRTHGFLVVPPEQLRRHFPRWDEWIAQSLHDLDEHLNDTLTTAGRVGDALRKRPFSLAADADADPRFEALGGTQKAARHHFGDSFAMYRRDSKDARNGGSLLTAQSGMGAATNLYDSPGHLRIQTALFPLFVQLYRTTELMFVPERFRVRTAGGQLPLHTDTCVNF